MNRAPPLAERPTRHRPGQGAVWLAGGRWRTSSGSVRAAIWPHDRMRRSDPVAVAGGRQRGVQMAGMIAQATGVRQRGRHGRQGAAHGASRATTAALCSSRRAGRGHDDDGPASRAATAALCSGQRARGGGRCREGIQGLAGCAGPPLCRPRRPRRGAGRQGPPPAGGGREPVAAARPTPDELPGASGTAQARSWPSDNPHRYIALRRRLTPKST